MLKSNNSSDIVLPQTDNVFRGLKYELSFPNTNPFIYDCKCTVKVTV